MSAKRIIKRVYKRTYGKMMEYQSTRTLRRGIRKAVKTRRRLKHRALNKRAFQSVAGYNAEQSGIREVDLQQRGETFAFGFDVLGMATGLDTIDYEDFAGQLKDILDNPDIDMHISCIPKDEKEKNKEIVDYFEKTMGYYMISPEEALLVTYGRGISLFLCVEIPREREEGEKITLTDKTLAQLAFAKSAQVDNVVCLGIREKDTSTKLTRTETKYVRLMGNLGIREFYGANAAGIHKGSGVKNLTGASVRTVASVSCLLGCQEDMVSEYAPFASVVIREKMLRMENDVFVKNRGFIPLYIRQPGENLECVTRMDYHNREHRRNENLMGALDYIENTIPPLRDIRNIMTIGDIFEVLEEEIPEKYMYLKDVSVNKICARSFEVARGDVMFFREPFNDPNDGEPKTLEERMPIVDKAMSRGARFIFSYGPLGDDIPHIVLDNCREAHIKICAHLRRMHEVRTIGITGSVGKTSTKDMLYNVLNEKYATFKNLRNSNTQVNIAMHIQNFKSSYEVYIQEIGGGRPGGASRHSRMILPEATVVTNIGEAHLGNYGTKEKTMESKLGIIDGMDENGTLYLNGDDPLLRTANVNAKTVFYAVDNKEADYYADNIVEYDGYTEFEIVHGDHRVPARVNVLGVYNVLNAVLCYAIGKSFKLTDEEITRGLLKFETSGMRQNLIQVAGYNLFVDCFNASPASIESSLSVLDSLQTDGRKIAVIGDVTGMAEMTEQVHKEIGDIVISHNPDLLVCYGEESKYVYDIAVANGKTAIHITSEKELMRLLKEDVQLGDVVLFKGSSKTLLSERIDEVYGTRLSDIRYEDGFKYKRVRIRGVRYYIFERYASIYNTILTGAATSVHLSKKVRGVPVYAIADGAFADLESLVDVDIPSTVRHIGAGAFAGCGDLETIDLSKGVKYIDEGAFAACSSLKNVKLGPSLMHIADQAFEDCISLEEIAIPSSVTQIGEKVFSGCGGVTVICEKGSYCEDYCKHHGIEYIAK